MIVGKYGNYVRKFMWQLCEWGRVNICMTFHVKKWTLAPQLELVNTVVRDF
jgi:hypothetical protein